MDVANPVIARGAPVRPVVVSVRISETAVTVPIEAVVQPATASVSETKTDQGPGPAVGARSINQVGVIHRNIEHLRRGGLDGNVAFVGIDGLLLVGLKVAGRVGLSSQALNRSGHVAHLEGGGLSKGLSPGQVLRHLLDHFRVVGQGFDGGIPGLAIHVAFWVGFKELIGRIDLSRI